MIGLTSSNNVSLAQHPCQDMVAYIAGSVVVLYDTKKNRQYMLLNANAPLPPSQVDGSSLSGSSLGVFTSMGSLSSAVQNPVKRVQLTLKPLFCVAFSSDGNFVAAGEVGHDPRILIWDTGTGYLVNEMKAHKFGVLSLCFSPNGKYLASIGHHHDGFLYIWNWKSGMKLASNKVSTKVTSLSY